MSEPEPQKTVVTFEPSNVWRIGFVILGVIAVGLFLRFLIGDGGSVIFTLLMAWFASLAMEPAVVRLAKHMKRGLATGVVMISAILFLVLFSIAFGKLFVDQIAQLVTSLPDLIKGIITWANEKFGTDYSLQEILTQLNLNPSDVASYASRVLGGLLGLLGSVVGGVFSLFTFGLFTFYFSADGPRFRRYMVSMFPRRVQGLFTNVWDITAQKTGGYVAARIILAAINGGTSAIVFWAIGMPSWLALGIWTGLVAQFVPTIGTYISIILPVIVGLLSPNPWIGVMALAWALLYQQVENLTIEPRISARAVDVHPAFAFAAVMLGAALFGVAGALLAIPVGAMLMSLVNIYYRRHEIADEAEAAQDGTAPAAS